MKVAIVHDWLIGGGAEKVVLELHRMFPQAPVYTSYATDEWRDNLDGKVITGYLQSWPFSKLRKFIPFLRGLWFSRLNLDGYDLVISSSGAEAKFVNTKPGTKHIAYIHAPTHYYWDRYEEYLKHPGFGAFDWLARLGLRTLVGPMRRWDFKAAQRPDLLIANSNFTSQQIKKYYGRDSTVVYPPVDVENFKLLNKSSNLRKGFVIAGRQTPYKRFDLAVAACAKLNLPLTVIGDGPDHKKLQKMAGPTVEFTGRIPTNDVIKYFQSAEAFIFPGLEDFGVVAVEAMAAGCPIIAYRAGGALDYIEPGKTGVFFNSQTTGELAKVLRSFISKKFDNKYVSAQAQRFSESNFQKNMKEFLTEI
jgi:glycosyltransferase involved in cell wall biosynthesis